VLLIVRMRGDKFVLWWRLFTDEKYPVHYVEVNAQTQLTFEVLVIRFPHHNL
jgi:hypothetical protein